MITRAATVLACAASLTLELGCSASSASAPAFAPGLARPTRAVRTWQEIRESRIVRQAWDLSCGSAALSTLLTHHLDDPTSEAAVIVWLLQRLDPVRVQSRGGFSLLDLKRFAEARGYKAEGYAGLALADLIELGPAIVPVRAKGYDHFVVVRGVVGDRVLIADPAFGNMTRRADRFGEIWTSGIGFVVQPRGGPAATRVQRTPLPDDLLVPDAGFAYRQIGSAVVSAPVRRSR